MRHSEPCTKDSMKDYERCFLDALIEGDRMACERITRERLDAQTPVLSLYQELYQPALYRIGDLWAANRISVAVEHMATAITEGLLNDLYPDLINPKRTGSKAVLATVENELHQVGVKMAGDVFEMHGWDSVFPGPGLSTSNLLGVLEKETPDLLGLSFSIFFNLTILERMLFCIRAEYPELPILVGGQGLAQGGEDLMDVVPGVRGMGNLVALSAFLDDKFNAV